MARDTADRRVEVRDPPADVVEFGLVVESENPSTPVLDAAAVVLLVPLGGVLDLPGPCDGAGVVGEAVIAL